MDPNRDKILKNLQNSVYRLSTNRTGRSSIWSIFSQILKSDDTVLYGYVYCHVCKTVLKYNGKQTSNLVRHKCYCMSRFKKLQQTVERKPAAPDIAKQESIEPDPPERIIIAEEETEAVQESKPQNELQNALDGCVQWVLEDCRPLSVINDSGFKKLVSLLLVLGAKYGSSIKLSDILPAAPTMEQHILAVAANRKDEIEPAIESAVQNGQASIAVHQWSDNNIKRNFLCLTLHYLQHTEFKELILGVECMEHHRANGADVLEKIEALLLEYGITNLDKLRFVSANDENIVNALDGLIRLNCSSQLFKNVVETSFTATTELAELSEKCKKVVKYLEMANMDQLLDRENLKAQCNTRWYAQYAMFKLMTENWNTIESLQMVHEELNYLSAADVKTLQQLVRLCRQFEIILLKLQDTKSETLCYVLLSIRRLKLICNAEPNDCATITALKQHMRQHIDSIWTANLNFYHKVAAFLYPPTNNTLDAASLAEVKEFCTQEILKHKPEIKMEHENGDAETAASSNDNQEFLEIFKDLIWSDKKKCRPAETEVLNYAHFSVSMVEDFDAVQWWQQHRNDYPYLSKVALNILGIPASCTLSERVVALASNMLMEQSTDLMPRSLNAILLLNSHMRNC